MIYNVAKLGRGGDTKIRNVDGEPSHVNSYEAYLIDTYKSDGEREVKRIGSGTINPATGMKEYQFYIPSPGGFTDEFGAGVAATGEDLAPSMWELMSMFESAPSYIWEQYGGDFPDIPGYSNFTLDLQEDDFTGYLLGLMKQAGLTRVEDLPSRTYFENKNLLLEALEEGRQSLESRDKGFGLKRKIGSIEGGAETARESSIQDYIPREISTRYGGLQGKGSTIAGELAEADYLSRQSEIGRMEAGKKRGTYREYGSEMFDALNRWLQGISG